MHKRQNSYKEQENNETQVVVFYHIIILINVCLFRTIVYEYNKNSTNTIIALSSGGIH